MERRRASLTVEAADAGRRVDAFLARRLPGASAAWARRAIAAGQVNLDGRRARKGMRVRAGQTVEVAGAGPGAAPAEPDPAQPLALLHEDADLVAVDKPAGIPSHPLRAGERGTVANALVARFPECAAAGDDPREGGLAHRLDRGTSGVLLAARSREAWLGLRAALRAPSCEKTYLAEVVGRPPARGTVTASIGRTGRRGARVKVEGGRSPLPASTDFELVEARGDTSLVRAQLHAGRAHQVRAHLASAGHPVVGDETYGTAAAGLHLHAESIRLTHPVTGRPVTITAPLPKWAR